MGKIETTEPRLVEVTSLPVIYVDDVGRLIVEGPNVRITFIEYRTFGTERVKLPVLEVVKPVASCRLDRFHNMMQMALGMPHVSGGSGGKH